MSGETKTDNWMPESESVRDSMQRLQRKVEELTVARQAAEAANQAKSNFLATMSHELRTPLHGLLGMAQLLLNTELNSQQRRYCRAVNSSGEALLRLINDILDFSKIEAGKLNLDIIHFDLRSAVEYVVELMAHEARQKGLELLLFLGSDVPARVRGDPGRLGQVLTNLISNAIKFTDQGKVVVTVTSGEAVTSEQCRVPGKEVAADNGHSSLVNLHFSVRDTGIGIAPDRIGRLFQSFSQVNSSTTRKYSGTGLGLAISKRLCELMGGAIGVESSPGEGSTFWYTVVLEKQPQETPLVDHDPVTHVTQADADRRKRARILLAEDDEINQELVTEILKNEGLRCDIVTDGLQAVSAVLRQPYDLVLMDCHMPDMDGFEATRQIRQREVSGQLAGRRSGPLPIIALTANAMTGDRETCLAAGMTDYLSKPFRLEDVVRTIDSYLAQNAGEYSKPALDTPALSASAECACPLDFDSLLQRCMGKRDFLKKIVLKFQKRLGKDMEELERSVALGNAGQVEQRAHSLKGAAANLSAEPLRAAAARLERLGRSRDLAAATPCLAELQHEVRQFLAFVADHREPGASASGGVDAGCSSGG